LLHRAVCARRRDDETYGRCRARHRIYDADARGVNRLDGRDGVRRTQVGIDDVRVDERAVFMTSKPMDEYMRDVADRGRIGATGQPKIELPPEIRFRDKRVRDLARLIDAKDAERADVLLAQKQSRVPVWLEPVVNASPDLVNAIFVGIHEDRVGMARERFRDE
jgi:hypothetical protein